MARLLRAGTGAPGLKRGLLVNTDNINTINNTTTNNFDKTERSEMLASNSPSLTRMVSAPLEGSEGLNRNFRRLRGLSWRTNTTMMIEQFSLLVLFPIMHSVLFHKDCELTCVLSIKIPFVHVRLVG